MVTLCNLCPNLISWPSEPRFLMGRCSHTAFVLLVKLTITSYTQPWGRLRLHTAATLGATHSTASLVSLHHRLTAAQGPYIGLVFSINQLILKDLWCNPVKCYVRTMAMGDGIECRALQEIPAGLSTLPCPEAEYSFPRWTH